MKIYLSGICPFKKESKYLEPSKQKIQFRMPSYHYLKGTGNKTSYPDIPLKINKEK